ncbi:hypothetical protein F4861DRAFT_48821 [Xylaria intraflava]|nr:hypothetical protein F4861DRAFT_48821 [Xylaria intraflava]
MRRNRWPTCLAYLSGLPVWSTSLVYLTLPPAVSTVEVTHSHGRHGALDGSTGGICRDARRSVNECTDVQFVWAEKRTLQNVWSIGGPHLQAAYNRVQHAHPIGLSLGLTGAMQEKKKDTRPGQRRQSCKRSFGVFDPIRLSLGWANSTKSSGFWGGGLFF